MVGVEILGYRKEGGGKYVDGVYICVKMYVCMYMRSE